MAGVARASAKEEKKENAYALFHLGLLVIRARRVIRARVSERLEAKGQSMSEWPILSHLARIGPSSQRDMAEAIACDPATVCRMVESMEERGLVERTRDDTDRRKLVVALSKSGRHAFDRLLPEAGWGVGEVVEHLSAKEKKDLERLLKKLLRDE